MQNHQQIMITLTVNHKCFINLINKFFDFVCFNILKLRIKNKIDSLSNFSIFNVLDVEFKY